MPREFVATVVSSESPSPVYGLTTYAVPPNVLSGATPGQFVMARCGTTHDPLLRRPFSPLTWDARQGLMTLLVLRGGVASRWLADRQPGDRVEMIGMLGRGFTIAPTTRRVLLVAGGVGIAPLVVQAERALARGISVTLLAGAASPAGLLPAHHVPSEVEYQVATADGSMGHHGFVTDLVAPYLRWADQVYACGPNPMFQALGRVLRQHGPPELVPPAQFSIEEYMACGLGVCVGCVTETRRGPQRVCKEGPVFEWTELAWV